MTRSILIKPASGSCNMRCDYCFYADEMKNREQQYYGMMELDTIRNIIKKTLLNANQPVSFAFQGGEPTLRGLDFFKAVMSYQKQYNHNHVPITNALQTNGTLLNAEWCQFFNKHHFLIGISIDGTRTLHDQYRHTIDNKPTFDLITEKIKLLEQYHVDYNILIVLTEQTASHIDEIYAYYKQNNWNFQQYIPCLDSLNHTSSKWALTPETYGKTLVRLFDLWYQDWCNHKQPYIRQFENWIGILAGIPPEACDQRGICSIQYTVEASGDVYPCDFYMLDAYLLGNFNTGKLKEFDSKRDELKFIECSTKHCTTCYQCPYFHICRNGCQRMRTELPDGSYQNQLCKAYYYFFEHCYQRLSDIANTIRQYL